MKKFLLILLTGVSPSLFSQVNGSFDVFSYQLPSGGWTESKQNDYISYTLLKKEGKGYCVIGFYKAVASSGNPETDCKTDWEQLARSIYPGIKSNGIQKETASGNWTRYVQSGKIIQQQTEIKVTVYSFNNRTQNAALMFIQTDSSYNIIIRSVLQSVTLAANPGTPQDTTPTVVTIDNPIAGKWSRSDKSGSSTLTRQYHFKEDGTYEYKYGVLVNNMSKPAEKGRYTVSQKEIRLVPDAEPNGNRKAPYALEWFYGQHPRFSGEANFGLQMYHANYGWECWGKKTETFSGNANSDAPGRPASINGLWKRSISRLTDFTNPASTITYQGYSNYSYRFNPNNTYTFTMEAWFGYLRNEYYFVTETGTYSVNGQQLTLTPKENKWVLRDKKKEGPVKQNGSNGLEKTTYTWSWYYWSGTQEWNLALQAAKETKRDGSFTSAGTLERAYYFKPGN